MHLSQELPANKQCSGGSRSLRRWKESLEDEKHSGRWSEVDKRTITEADLTTAQEVVQELNIDHLMVIWHLKQIGKVKCLISQCLMSWQKIKKKNLYFEVSSSLSLHNNRKSFLNWIVMCNEKQIYTTTGDNQLSGWTKKKLQSTSQSQTCTPQKKKTES